MRRKHRKTRKEKRKSQKQIIIISVISLFLLTAVGYAAFQTNISINTKGNIKQKPFNIEKLKENMTSSNDGLYRDTYEENRYIYRGSNPDNYIELDNKLYRIISIEPDNALKVVLNTPESRFKLPYDTRTSETEGPRYNSENTYCTLARDGTYWGCNAWSKVDGTLVNGNASGTVTLDSSLNTFLNNDYYLSLSSHLRNHIIKYNHRTGFIRYNITLENVISDEKTNLWNGFIAIENKSDFIKASLNSECTTVITNPCGNSASPCSLNNYLFHNNIYMWFLNATLNVSDAIATIYGNGGFCDNGPQNRFYVLPSFYLSSATKLTGYGTESKPYKIHTEN